MDSSSASQIIALVFLVTMSAVFSSSETAITSVSKIKVRQLDQKDNKNAHLLKKLHDNMQATISTILIGNNIVNIAASSIATILFTKYFNENGAVVSTVVMTIFVLIFGEVLPKTIAQYKNKSVALKFSRFIYLLTIIFKPIVKVLNLLTRLVIKLFIGEDGDSSTLTEEELKTLVEVSEEEGVIKNQETEIMINALELKKTLAVDIMTPRTSMASVDIEDAENDLKEIIKNITYSRIPVYEDNIDDIIGVLHIKELAHKIIEDDSDFKIRDILKPAFYAYEYIPVVDLFKQMRAKNISISIIIDEYGGTSGIVTMEDILEELVGEIDDEYDNEKEVTKLSDNEYLVDPEMRIDEVNERFDLNIQSEKFDSIGGFVIELLDRMPKSKDEVEFENLKFVVVNVDKRKITQLMIIFK
ncbi:MAG: hemolysin family protein [Finegoldia magna]|uniref:hemolysin family protein n=1 Tax=Finegoldia TaxID=150022 RepID=UPI0025D8BA12|nr:hemolysin family protein [Finegoldia magna]MBS5777011.1 HlyC/CorC family transporter [Finegoldia magna]MDU1579635.1 hemolysin family protein [Finegoldia magna]MDU1600320.1 hemolysin family protein [Finegoldia magna]MDU1832749.1 hemolysin family protein [Finegoldia magna]MDU1878288.1 hemolysin family protein [Finegoldia magna]